MRPLTRSPFCRPGTAPGGRISATPPSLAWRVFGVERLQRRRVLGKERARAQFDEARLRAEAAEAVAASEREGKEAGRAPERHGARNHLVARLRHDFRQALRRRQPDGGGGRLWCRPLSRRTGSEIEYQLAIERGKRYAPYTRTTTDRDQLPVWCIEHREPVFINDVRAEYGKYVSRYEEPRAAARRRHRFRAQPKSIIYLPLLAKDRVLGIITIQSFESQRLHRASPQRAAQPGVVHGHRAGQRRRLPAAERTGARDPAAARRRRAARAPRR